MNNAIIYQLYLFQLENYELSRYFQLLMKKGIFPSPKLRGQLKWTGKAKLLLFLSLIIHLVLSVVVAAIAYEIFFDFWVTLLSFLFVLVAFIFFYFLFFAVASSFIFPFQAYLSSKITSQATAKVKKLKNLKVIGIAGSYGKTGMKEALKSVLSEKFKTLATPDSVNTPLGIARFVNSKVDEKTEVLIIEMGEHYQGDVAELSQMTPVDIGVITGINESHQERMGDMDTAIATIFELTGGLKDSGMLVLNVDDANVRDHHHKFTAGTKIDFYSSNDQKPCEYKITDYRFSPNKLTNYFSISSNGDKVGDFQSKVLGEYIKGVAVAAVIVGRQLGMTDSQIINGLAKIKPTSHRLEPIINPNGLVIIDDSYNGNPDGVREAIKLLAKFEGKRKVYLTPGLVEMGESTAKVHQEIGLELAEVADLVLLIKNSVTPFIEQGLQEAGFDDEKIIWYPGAVEAHASLDKVLKSGDVIVFQNDWGDQYV